MGTELDTMRKFETEPIEAALARFEKLGGESLVDRMIAAFLESAGRAVDASCRANDRGDADGIRRAAHSLKSSAANFGAARLQHLARSIEKIATTASPHPEDCGRLDELVRQLPTALGDVRRHLMGRRSEA